MSPSATPRWLAPGLIEGDETVDPGTTVQLTSSWCPPCDRYEFPFRASCPGCGGETESRSLSSQAILTGFTAVNHALPGALVEAPYVVAIAAFPEGISILGTVVGAEYGELSLGGRVRTVAVDVGGNVGYGYQLATFSDGDA